MRILSFLILLGLISFAGFQEQKQPHGAGFKISCSKCHSSKGWQLDRSVYSFDHNTTKMPLTGQHVNADCKKCHVSLIFSEAKTECIACHKDIHQGTTDPNCSRCHTTISWLVNDITRLHQMSRFPLLGPHRTADCISCHKSENPFRFDVPGVNCYDCHKDKYDATTNPNHGLAGFSTDCVTCHLITSFSWTGAGFNHSFFPLVQGHAIPACADCHKGGAYTKIPTDCYSCHQANYNSTTNPNHVASNFPTNCSMCHTLAVGWKPANFDHSLFPLTQGHSGVACEDCHKGNYTSTSTDCYSCHKSNYDGTTNPNHAINNFSTVCTTCHTTAVGWKPATFNHTTFPLTLGHAGPTCEDCHKGNYNNTSTDCYSCHKTNYDNTTNPVHSSLTAYGFSTDCKQCHTTNPGWKPATFAQHDALFPISTGRHSGIACNQCHTITTDYTQFNCIACHANAHPGQNYTNAQCYQCHPRGTSDKK